VHFLDQVLDCDRLTKFLTFINSLRRPPLGQHVDLHSCAITKESVPTNDKLPIASAMASL
jgi:hypothetical protein